MTGTPHPHRPAGSIGLGSLPEPNRYERLRLVLSNGALPAEKILEGIADPTKPREYQVAALASLCEDHGVKLSLARFDGKELSKQLTAIVPVAEVEAVRSELKEIRGIRRFWACDAA